MLASTALSRSTAKEEWVQLTSPTVGFCSARTPCYTPEYSRLPLMAKNCPQRPFPILLPLPGTPRSLVILSFWTSKLVRTFHLLTCVLYSRSCLHDLSSSSPGRSPGASTRLPPVATALCAGLLWISTAFSFWISGHFSKLSWMLS